MSVKHGDFIKESDEIGLVFVSGPKTFDVIWAGGSTSRYRHDARDIALVAADALTDLQRNNLLKEASAARDERKRGADTKRRQIWHRRNTATKAARTKNTRKQYRKRHPARSRAIWRAWSLRRCYGITTSEFLAMLAEQDGRCAICRSLLATQHIDHDHVTLKIRGILCVLCNVALAHFKDDVETMLRAMEYIKAGGFHYVVIGERLIPDPEYLAKRNRPRSRDRRRRKDWSR